MSIMSASDVANAAREFKKAIEASGGKHATVFWTYSIETDSGEIIESGFEAGNYQQAIGASALMQQILLNPEIEYDD